VGSDYATVVSQVDTSLLNSGTEAQIEAQLSNLRTAFASNKSIQVTTYTYSPLIGMMSSTDPAGHIMYYEYDGFGRLIDIKDQYGNIIKHIAYHYQGQ
ncbi:MAG TPA: hypothetical protein VN081_04615, partial [Dongiaceae bacterium]|nr:hypothetical protein [Dongiaceae bacterium]